MIALAGVEPVTLVSEPDALTTRPPPCAVYHNNIKMYRLKHDCFTRGNHV